MEDKEKTTINRENDEYNYYESQNPAAGCVYCMLIYLAIAILIAIFSIINCIG